MKSLLIGCGNIGAMYDYSDNRIISHAKAYNHFGFDVHFIEPVEELAEKVILKYNFTRKVYTDISLRDYNYVSICTPTNYHYCYLLDALKAEVPLIICEKPISNSYKELEEISRIYKNGKSKILVNYIRRFQSIYENLRFRISDINEPLQSINCNYYKGVMNYASHALDIIEYLTGIKLSVSGINIIYRNNDFFSDDPTMTFNSKQGGTRFYFNGIISTYPLFEVDLFFVTFRVQLMEGGNTIVISHNGLEIFRKENALENYMIGVFDKAKKMLEDIDESDNFNESLQLNKKLLNLIN